MPTQLKMKRAGIKSKIAGKILNEEIRRDLKTLGDQVVSLYFNQITRHWESNITFKVSIQSTGSRIILSVIPQGDEEALKNWELVNEGRPGGIKIVAKNPSGVMRYLSNYVRKTGLAVSGQPGRSGEWVSAREVTQGAVEPGNFVEEAQEKYVQPNFAKVINRGYQRTWARARKESR